jgi:hypothetical protein
MSATKYNTELPSGAWDSHVHIVDEVRYLEISATPPEITYSD